MTSRSPWLRSVRSLTSEMPTSFLAWTPSLIFSMTRSGPTRYGSSVTTRPVLRGGEVLHRDLGPRAERAAARGVGVPHARQPDDRAARGQVGARHVLHQFLERGLRVHEQVLGGLDHLAEVVRRHVRRHADRDARGAVDEQVRERGGQHAGLHDLVVVVRDEVDDVLAEALGHRHRRLGQTRLGVPRGGGPVVERAEVAVPVDERHAHGERLRQADQGVVDRAVAVRVELAHHLAGDAGALDVTAVGAQAHLGHLVQDASLHGLQAVAGVGERPRVDDGVRVLEEGALHLLGDVDVLDALTVGEADCVRACHGTFLQPQCDLGDSWGWQPAYRRHPTTPRTSPTSSRVASSRSAPRTTRGCARNGLEARIALRPARSAIVVLVDGLGANALSARSGHARFLAATKKRLRSGFPTTTAAALSTLTTGRSPGTHGVVGYSGWNPDTGAVMNLLSGWDDEVPAGWLRSTTLFTAAATLGVDPVVVGPARYRSSGMTANVLGGARYVAGRLDPRAGRRRDRRDRGRPQPGLPLRAGTRLDRAQARVAVRPVDRGPRAARRRTRPPRRPRGTGRRGPRHGGPRRARRAGRRERRDGPGAARRRRRRRGRPALPPAHGGAGHRRARARRRLARLGRQAGDRGQPRRGRGRRAGSAP